MKKIGISFLLLLGIFGQNLMAQAEQTGFNLADRLVPHVGLMQMIPFQTVSDQGGPEIIEDIFANRRVVQFANLHVGAYMTLFHRKDFVSVGLDNSIQVGVNPNFANNGLPATYNIQVPIIAMARMGSGATPYNQQRFGIGAGIGASINHMKFTMFRPNENPSVDDLAVIRTTTFVTPTAIVEVSYGSLIGRLHLGLAPVNTRVTDEVVGFNPPIIEEGEAVHGMFGFGLIYRFQ